MAAGVELNEDAVRVGYLDGVSDVAFSDRRMFKAEQSEMGTPDLKVVAITDAERYRSEAIERSGTLGFEM
jgi:hypothetical protein